MTLEDPTERANQQRDTNLCDTNDFSYESYLFLKRKYIHWKSQCHYYRKINQPSFVSIQSTEIPTSSAVQKTLKPSV